MTHQIAVIGGDGIGTEVTAEALKVVRAAGVAIDTTEFDLGGARYLRDGEILSDATLEQLRGFDAILLGAVGTPDVPPGVIERGLLLKMRFELDLYVNQRPFTAPGHDFVVIRENTEGPYVGEGGVLRRGTPHEVAIPHVAFDEDVPRVVAQIRQRVEVPGVRQDVEVDDFAHGAFPTGQPHITRADEAGSACHQEIHGRRGCRSTLGVSNTLPRAAPEGTKKAASERIRRRLSAVRPGGPANLVQSVDGSASGRILSGGSLSQ